MSSLITDVAVERDDLNGTWFHPDVPFDFDIFEAWRAENNLEVEYVTFENTASDELRELSETDYDAAMRKWDPPAPEGDGWICCAIYSTEDGPMSSSCATRWHNMQTLISLSSATGYGSVLLNTGDSEDLHNAVQRILGDGLVNEHDYHVTLMYDKSNPQMPIITDATYYAKPIGAELFGPDNNTLVLTLSCPELVARHKFLLRDGFNHSYPEFNPHITIKYDATAGDLEKLREALKHVDYLPKKLRLSNESWEPIDEEWKPKTDS